MVTNIFFEKAGRLVELGDKEFTRNGDDCIIFHSSRKDLWFFREPRNIPGRYIKDIIWLCEHKGKPYVFGACRMKTLPTKVKQYLAKVIEERLRKYETKK